MKLYFTLFALLSVVTTVSAAENHGPDTFLAPAAAPTTTDSLPTGRHKVSSYRNGSSIEVVVEDQEIQSLKVDGKEVPENEYDQYQGRVEKLLGTNEKGDNEMRMFRWSEEDLEGMEERFEGMGERFEKMGENFELRFEGMGEDMERMGERLSQSLERMFEGSGDVMRFQFRSDGDGNWEMDSTGDGRSFEWHSDGMPPNGFSPEMPADGHSEAEAEIQEMETMIEQMERRKARMQRDLERQDRDLDQQQRNLERQQRDLEREERNIERKARQKERSERREASYEVIVEQLQREGLIEDSGRLRKLSVDANQLKVNGKKASQEGHSRFMELYEQQTGQEFSKGSSISIKKN
jgi:hypothetical protein